MVIELALDDDDEGGGVGIPSIEGGSQFAFAFRDGVNASSVPSTPYKAATCVVPFRRRVDAGGGRLQFSPPIWDDHQWRRWPD